MSESSGTPQRPEPEPESDKEEAEKKQMKKRELRVNSDTLHIQKTSRRKSQFDSSLTNSNTYHRYSTQSPQMTLKLKSLMNLTKSCQSETVLTASQSLGSKSKTST